MEIRLLDFGGDSADSFADAGLLSRILCRILSAVQRLC